MANKSKTGGGKKGYKFGGKQQNGHSRASYFSRRKMGLAAKNKAKAIERDKKMKAKCRAKARKRSPEGS